VGSHRAAEYDNYVFSQLARLALGIEAEFGRYRGIADMAEPVAASTQSRVTQSDFCNPGSERNNYPPTSRQASDRRF
jgi:hypothetical protein